MAKKKNDEHDASRYSLIFEGYDDYIDYRLHEAKAQQQALHGVRVQGVRDTHFIHEIGKYATPSSNTWEAYSDTVRACDLGFNAKGYAFDKAIAQASGNRAIYDPAARHYTDYEPLRHNIAVVRNFILNHVYGEEVDAEEARNAQKLAYITQMGGEIGAMLRRGNNPLLANPLAPSLGPRSANAEYDGAIKIYKKLLSIQGTNGLMAPVHYVAQLSQPQHIDRAWRLPPIELTPFGKLNFYAPPPADSIATSEALPIVHTDGLQAQALKEEMSQTLEMDAIGTAFAQAGIGYNSVENLSQPIKIQAIEIAREILEKLKIQFASTPVMAMLDYTSGQFQRTMTDLSSVITIYKDHLQRAVMLDPSLAGDPMIQDAGDAIGFLGAQIKLKALDRAEIVGDTEHADLIRQELSQLPPHWMNPNRMTSMHALAILEQGLNMVVATLAMTQEEGMHQSQREILLDAAAAPTVASELHRRSESLAYDEQLHKIAAERRNAFAGLGGTKAPSGMPKNTTIGALPDGAASGKKEGRDIQITSSVTVGSVFDNLLQSYGANMQQMQSSINAPTSGNFSMAAPGSAQQIIQQVIAHREQSTQQGTRTFQREQRRQVQREQKRQEGQLLQQRRERRQAQKDANAAAKQQESAADTPINTQERPATRPPGTGRNRDLPTR